MTLSADRLAEFDAFLIELNRASAGVILPLFRADHGLENKLHGGFDPVTEADKGAERAIRALIAHRYPDHGVIGEEYGEDRPDAEFVWVLDPVDGTRAFIAGLPLWTTLIGLRHEGRPVLGSIGQPYIGELYIGGAATGSRLMSRGREAPLRVRACPKLTDAIICTTDPDILTGPELGAWTQVRAAARLARLGLDAYGYAMVAAGTMDLALDTGLKVWDVEAVIAVVEGAGGVCAHWDGSSAMSHGGKFAFAGDRACLDEALVALKRAARD
ncbi:MAG TPA: histidinol-phosphatase [Caulobacter sp.]|nr:histidinol-phosphatase [Caulobacter sp.]